MNPTNTMFSERSQILKRYTLWFILYKDKNKQNKTMLLGVRRTVTVAQEGSRRESSEELRRGCFLI